VGHAEIGCLFCNLSVYKSKSLPMSPYDINSLIEDRAKLFTGQLVSFDRIASRKGPAITDENNKNWIQEISHLHLH
jgi:hypothetical protein